MVSKIKNLWTSPTCQSEEIKQVSLKKMSKRQVQASTLTLRGCITFSCETSMRFQWITGADLTECNISEPSEKSERINSENIDLFVYVPFVQAVYFLPPKVSIAVQLPERPVRVKILRDITAQNKTWVSLLIRSQRITGRLAVFCVKLNHSLDAVSEEVRFVCMHDDDIKKVSPVLSHHVSHSFVPADGKE